MQSQQCNSNLYYSSQIKKLNQNSKQYHVLIKQFLSNYKVHPCSQQLNHNANTCFFFHNLDDCRRNPYREHQFLYNPFQICDCFGPDCIRFHNQFQRLYHPLFYKKNKCSNQSICEFGFYCYFSHAQDLKHFEHGQFFRFDLRTFKTQKCFNKNHHERKTCLYYHNDKDKRRPSHIVYDHFICQNQKCNNGMCQFSHNKLEQLYHSNRYKTKFCQHYQNGIEKCPYKDFCSFAHTIDQIISNIELLHLQQKNTDFYINKYKTVWCPFTQNHERDKCPYAHNIQDYRRNPTQYHYEATRCQFWNFSDQIKSIDGAGCKFGNDCKKCHGWMQQRYHPTKYTSKRNFEMKKEDIQAAEIILNKKLNDLNFPSQIKSKVKVNLALQIPKKNFTKGTPFFKNDKGSEYSAKTKARSNNIESQKSKSIDNSSNKDIDKVDTIKTNPLPMSNGFVEPSNDDGDFQKWKLQFSNIRNKQTLNEKDSSRSKSAPRSEQYEASYSKSINDVLEDAKVRQRFRNENIHEIQIMNMDQSKLDKLSFLTSQQKSQLAIKLNNYNLKQMNTVSYSKQLTKYFIVKKKDGILQKMQAKKVKQAKLLKLVAKQINQLSFLQTEQKNVLPKLLKQYRDQKQFKELSLSIVEETKMK